MTDFEENSSTGLGVEQAFRPAFIASRKEKL
jgi:hypothetical protein